MNEPVNPPGQPISRRDVLKGLFALAAAYAEAGQFGEAVRYQIQAMQNLVPFPAGKFRAETALLFKGYAAAG